MSGQESEYSLATPKKTNWFPLKAWLIVVGVIIAGIVIFAVAQPHFELTEISYDNALPSCGWFTTTQSVGARFTLVNSGLVDGYATVQFTGGGYDLGTQTYYVLAGSSITDIMTRYVDCSSNFYVVVYITSVRGPFG